MGRFRVQPAVIIAIAAGVTVAVVGVALFVGDASGGSSSMEGDRSDSAHPGASGRAATAATTGVPDGVTLRPSEGLSITEAGAVVDGLDIADGVAVRAADVTIRNSRITATGQQGIKIDEGASLRIEDSEIVGTSDACNEGISFGSYEAVRIDVSGCQDGLKANGDTVVRDSYIHDLRQTDDSHNDGIQSMSGSGITIEGNTICAQYRDSVSAIKLTPERGAIDGVTIRDNVLFGGNFTLYMDSKPGGYGVVTNALVEGNTIVAGSYAHGAQNVDGDPSQVFRGNVESASDLCGGGRPA